MKRVKAVKAWAIVRKAPNGDLCAINARAIHEYRDEATWFDPTWHVWVPVTITPLPALRRGRKGGK